MCMYIYIYIYNIYIYIYIYTHVARRRPVRVSPSSSPRMPMKRPTSRPRLAGVGRAYKMQQLTK